MNEYIFYTSEGYTQPPRCDKEVDNSQILGRAFGEDVTMAKKNFFIKFPSVDA